MSENNFLEQFKENEMEFFVNSMEAVLFASGDPVEIERLCELFNVNGDTIKECAKRLDRRLKERDTSFELIRIKDSYQLCTKVQFQKYVTEFLRIKRTSPLSKPALEALAIVAYKQPVTRSYIEKVRGVDCGGIMATLLQRELIEEVGRLEGPGKPIIYGTTDAFLRAFGLTSLEELPPVEEPYRSLLRN